MLFFVKLFAIFLIFSITFLLNIVYINGALFNVELERITPLQETSDIVTNSNVRVKKFNHTTSVIAGDFNLNAELNEKNMVSIEMFYSASGSINQLNKTPFHVKTSLCEYMNTAYRDIYMNDLALVSNLPAGDTLCPIKPNLYWIKDYACNLRDLSAGKSGLWRYDIAIWNETAIIGGFKIFVILSSAIPMKNN